MRTKILLAAAAALAAGVMASNAQVYSANVVGYVTVTSAGGAYSLLANPLDNGSNTLASLVTAPTGSHALIWTGTTFTGSTKTPTSWSPNPVVAPGQGFFLQPTGVNPVTNTFVGNVIAAPGGGTVTNSFGRRRLQLGRFAHSFLRGLGWNQYKSRNPNRKPCFGVERLNLHRLHQNSNKLFAESDDYAWRRFLCSTHRY